MPILSNASISNAVNVGGDEIVRLALALDLPEASCEVTAETLDWKWQMSRFSTIDGLSRALKPRRIVTHPNAAAPTLPATIIDRRTVRFLMRLPLLGACAHLERDVDLTHRLVDSARLRRSFEAVREQVGL